MSQWYGKIVYTCYHIHATVMTSNPEANVFTTKTLYGVYSWSCVQINKLIINPDQLII